MPKKLTLGKNQPYLVPAFYITVSTLITGLLVAAAFLARPIADDYAYFSNAAIDNPFKFMYDFFMHQTGRLGQGFFVSTLHALFGDAAVIAGALIQLVALIGVSVWLTYLLLSKLKRHRLINAIAVGSFGAITTLLVSASIFDTYLWFTSSSVYLMSLIFMVASAAVLLTFSRLKKLKFWHYLLVFIMVLVGQTFSEPTSAIIIVLLTILATYNLMRKLPNKLPLTALVASVAGFLLVYLSPGSQNRQDVSESAFSAYAVIVKPIFDTINFSDFFFSWRILPVIALSVLIAYVLPKLKKQSTLIVLGIAAIFIIVPPYILFAITNYSMGEYIPIRTYTVPLALSAIGISLAIGIGLYWAHEKLKSKYKSIALPALGYITVSIAFVATLPAIVTIIQAESLRIGATEFRTSSIHAQLAENKESISILPAPIFLNESEAIDFYFGKEQISWFESSFKRYYSIPEETKLVYLDQPLGYCMDTQNPSWFGVETCYIQGLNSAKDTQNE